MKSSSLTNILQAKGIDSPRLYRDALIHDWDPGTKVTCHLEVFILRRVFTTQFFDYIKDGELRFNKRLYSVIWMNVPSVIRAQNYCIVSFRFCSLLERGYALVRMDNDNPNVQVLNLSSEKETS